MPVGERCSHSDSLPSIPGDESNANFNLLTIKKTIIKKKNNLI